MRPAFSFDHARLRRLALYATLGVAGAITVLSLVSNGSLPGVSGSDKLKHFIAYAGLAAPMTVWLGARRMLRVVAIAVAFGFAIEIAQGMMTAGRTASLGDALANTLGAITGSGLVALVSIPGARWRRPKVHLLPK